MVVQCNQLSHKRTVNSHFCLFFLDFHRRLLFPTKSAIIQPTEQISSKFKTILINDINDVAIHWYQIWYCSVISYLSKELLLFSTPKFVKNASSRYSEKKKKTSVAGWISISRSIYVIFHHQQWYKHHFKVSCLELFHKIATEEG